MSLSRIFSTLPSNLANNVGKLISITSSDALGWLTRSEIIEPAYAQANNAVANTIYLQGVSATQNSRLSSADSNTTYLLGISASQNSSISLLGSRTSSLESNTVYLQGALNQTNTDIVTANTNLKSYVDSNVSIILGIDNTQNTRISSGESRLNYLESNTVYLLGVDNSQNTRLSSTENDILSLVGVNAYQNSQISTANTWLQANDYNTWVTSQSYTDTANASLKQYSDNSFYLKTGGLISGSVTIQSNLLVSGNLTVSGNVTTVSANNLSIKDNMIYLNSDLEGYVDPDLGIAGAYYEGSYRHAGFFRDASDGYWKVYDNYQPEPDASPWIDTSNASFRIASFQANNVTFGKITTSSSELVSNLNSDLLDGQHGSYYAVAAEQTGINATQNTNITNVNSFAQSAYNVANTDVTYMTATASTYGDSVNVPKITLLANGRVSSITNTSISFPVTSVAGATGSVSNSQIVSGINTIGGLTNASLVNTSITINGTSISLGGSGSIIAGATITDDTSTNATRYVMLGTATSGNYTVANTSSTKLSFNPSSGTLSTSSLTVSGSDVSPKRFVNRSGGPASGINWYSNTYLAWTEYMSPAGQTGCGPTANITAPSGTFVTAWALRSFIENASGYGWTWESGTLNQVTPTVKAEIRSSDGTFWNAGNIYSAGDIYSAYSDISLKEKIGDITNAIEKVTSIETLYYVPNEVAQELGVSETGIKVGVSAQSVQKVAPEVVAPSAINNKYLTVQYERLVPYLIEAIKEQQSQIELLKGEIESLRGE